MFKIKSYFEIEEKSKFLRKNKKNFKIFFLVKLLCKIIKHCATLCTHVFKMVCIHRFMLYMYVHVICES